MKNLLALSLILFTLITSSMAQSNLSGAWKLSDGDTQYQLLLSDGFFCYTIHEGNKFISSKGGPYWTKDDVFYATIFFNSADSSDVNKKMTVPFSISGSSLNITVPQGEATFTKIDDGKGPLAAVWRITGRKGDDGKVSAIHQTGSRQTYKVLTGSKFQWIAIDPEKKQFSGTGGGSYTFKDGKYTENIEFFSRDNSRVGASLVFDGKLEDKKWHHSGLSSKGDKIYEIWETISIEASPKDQQ